MQKYRINKLRGKWAIVWQEGSIRRRYSLDTTDRKEAEARAPSIHASLTRASRPLVADLWQEYLDDNSHKAVIATMGYTWKAIGPKFGKMEGPAITVADCKNHIDERRSIGISNATIRTELAHLSMALNWARKNNRIDRAPYIHRPPATKPKDVAITRAEAKAIMAQPMPAHIKLAIHLMIGTGARIGALLELTWDRVDFNARKIHLTNPFDATRRKGRPVAAMNDQCRQSLIEAKERAVTPFVIEYRGKPVGKISKAIKTLGLSINRDDITPHVFRHSAAVWLVEDGTPIAEIAQFLGHSSTATTFEVYARYSTSHLSKAAKSLEI